MEYFVGDALRCVFPLYRIIRIKERKEVVTKYQAHPTAGCSDNNRIMYHCTKDWTSEETQMKTDLLDL